MSRVELKHVNNQNKQIFTGFKSVNLHLLVIGISAKTIL